jgi:hypothetical protein
MLCACVCHAVLVYAGFHAEHTGSWAELCRENSRGKKSADMPVMLHAMHSVCCHKLVAKRPTQQLSCTAFGPQMQHCNTHSHTSSCSNDKVLQEHA